jgi:hypothetical protein
MQTTRTVHVIEETEQIAHAISVAARLWPEIANHREMLLGKILEAGLEELEKISKSQHSNRLDAIEKTAGVMNDVWPYSWRDELRNDWPN